MTDVRALMFALRKARVGPLTYLVIVNQYFHSWGQILQLG